MQCLYKNLLNKKPVNYSFKKALRACRARQKADEFSSCCCNHDHDPNCKWEAFRKQFGEEKAHEMHHKKCKCDKIKNNIHLQLCKDLKVYKEELDKIEIIGQEKKPKKETCTFSDFDSDFSMGDLTGEFKN